MSMSSFAARREVLTGQAALRAAAGQSAAPLLPALRRLTTAELLAGPGVAAGCVNLSAVASAVCVAAEQAVRRRGWLRVAVMEQSLPVAAPGRLLQAALLAGLRGALAGGTVAEVRCFRCGGAAVLCLCGGANPTAAALLRHLAGHNDGLLLLGANAPFSAILRLPLAKTVKKTTICRAEDLLTDRYSVLYQYLEGFCAGPEE